MPRLVVSSAENSSVKAELGARLQREILPFVLLTQTTERFYSKPRGYAGDFQTIDMIYRESAGRHGTNWAITRSMFFEFAASQGHPQSAVFYLPRKLWESCRQRMARLMLPALPAVQREEIFDVFQAT